MFANDARLSVIEWDAECSLTALQCQEVTDALNSSNLASCGYIALPDAEREIPVPLGSQVTCEYDWATDNRMTPVETSFPLAFHFRQGVAATDLVIDMDAMDPFVHKNYRLISFQTPGYPDRPPQIDFDFHLQSCTDRTMSFDGYLWAKVNIGGNQKGAFVTPVCFVPWGADFNWADDSPDKLECANQWSVVQTAWVSETDNSSTSEAGE